MNHKKYMDIPRYGHKSTFHSLVLGDDIIIQEKIDGANASFMRDGDKLRVFSRNRELDESNTLSGFYGWVHDNIDPLDLLNGVIYFGEWTAPHKIKYPRYEKKFFLFDVFFYAGRGVNREGFYAPFYVVNNEAKRLQLHLCPTFYVGKYTGIEHVMQWVGKTALGGTFNDQKTGEGIVIKNVSRFDKHNRQHFVKIVIDDFKEVNKVKQRRELTPEQLFVAETVTKPRVEKIVQKMKDFGIFEGSYEIEDMGEILRNVNPAIIEDILKEEKDSLPVDYNEKLLSRAVAHAVPVLIKEILKDNGGHL